MGAGRGEGAEKVCVFNRRAPALSLPAANVMPVGSALYPPHFRTFRLIIYCIKTKQSRSFFKISF